MSGDNRCWGKTDHLRQRLDPLLPSCILIRENREKAVFHEITGEKNPFLWEEDDLIAAGMGGKLTQQNALAAEIDFSFTPVRFIRHDQLNAFKHAFDVRAEATKHAQVGSSFFTQFVGLSGIGDDGG